MDQGALPKALGMGYRRGGLRVRNIRKAVEVFFGAFEAENGSAESMQRSDTTNPQFWTHTVCTARVFLI